jgi:hypothetical protein
MALLKFARERMEKLLVQWVLQVMLASACSFIVDVFLSYI